MGVTAWLIAVEPDMLKRIKKDPKTFKQYRDGLEDTLSKQVDLHKAWDAIHFVLTGSMEWSQKTASIAIFGADYLSESARSSNAKKVREIAKALESITLEVFAQRYDYDAMLDEGVHLALTEDDPAELLAEISEFYEGLRTFYLLASERGDCVISMIG